MALYMDFVRLRPYQFDGSRYVIQFFMSGRRQVALVFPMGSGKSYIATYIAQLLQHGPLAIMKRALLATPLESVMRSFIGSSDSKSRLPIRKNIYSPHTPIAPDLWAPKTKIWSKISTPVSKFNPTEAPIFGVCTHAFLYQWIRAQPGPMPNLEGHLLIIDEAHHTSDVNLTNKIRDAWLEAGGILLYLTATPYRSDGKPVFDANATSSYYRSAATHADEGFAPKNWEYLTEVMPDCSPDGSEDHIRKGAEHIAKHWDLLERPKTVIKVPSTGSTWDDNPISLMWAKALKTAFAKYVPADRVLDAVGDSTKTKKNFNAAMAHESAIKHYDQSKYGVVLACKRFDEATDWSLCSVAFMIGPPMRSMPALVQFFGRTLRLKRWNPETGEGIQGYPEKYVDKALLVSFLYDRIDRSATNRREHERRVVMLTALMERSHYGFTTLRNEFRSILGLGVQRNEVEQIFERISAQGMLQEIASDVGRIGGLHKLSTKKNATLKDVYRGLIKKKGGLDPSEKIALLALFADHASRAEPDKAHVVKDFIKRAALGIDQMSRRKPKSPSTKTPSDTPQDAVIDYLADQLDDLVEKFGDHFTWSPDHLFNSVAANTSRDAKVYATILGRDELLGEMADTDEKVCHIVMDQPCRPTALTTFTIQNQKVSFNLLDDHVRNLGTRFKFGVLELAKYADVVLNLDKNRKPQPLAYTRVEILNAMMGQTLPSGSTQIDHIRDKRFDATKAFGRATNWAALEVALDRGWWGLPSGLNLTTLQNPPWSWGDWTIPTPQDVKGALQAFEAAAGRGIAPSDYLKDACEYFPGYGKGILVWQDVLHLGTRLPKGKV